MTEPQTTSRPLLALVLGVAGFVWVALAANGLIQGVVGAADLTPDRVSIALLIGGVGGLSLAAAWGLFTGRRWAGYLAVVALIVNAPLVVVVIAALSFIRGFT